MTEPPLTYTPFDEPYLGRQPVLIFDHMISGALEANLTLAKSTHDRELSSLQIAGTQIIPHGISLALSIRELVRQGYLLAGEVLVRPLMERAAVISYLAENPAKTTLWEAGWPYKSRPSLKVMLAAMAQGSTEFADIEDVASQIVKEHNALVHADPAGANRHAAMIGGRLSYSVSKSTDEPERCDRLCLEAMCWLSVLTSRASAIYGR